MLNIGYFTFQNDSNKKLVCNVFCEGDAAFVSGDILVSDELGYLYFRDRTGDTYKWKGENVATAEVEDAMSPCLEQRPCVVYGVSVSHSYYIHNFCVLTFQVPTDGLTTEIKAAEINTYPQLSISCYQQRSS